MVDIVMATYNGGLYIREQLDSILNQTYKDIRIIVRDDGSTDDTVEIIRKYEKIHPGKIVLISDDVKCGSSQSNFMQALENTTAEYVMFSDQDDYWLPEKIQHTLDRMIEIENRVGRDKPVLVFGSYRLVDENLKEIVDNPNNRQEAAYKLKLSSLLVQNYVQGCLMMVNRTLIDLMGEYDDAILMHDWWGALIAAGGGVIEHIDEVMMLYRQHKDNIVGSVNVKSFRYRLKKVFDPETRNANKAVVGQARLLKDRCYESLTDGNREVLDEYIDLYRKNKIGRVVSLLKGDYLKSDFIRVLGQIWYI